MHHITEHNTKQEWERYYGKKSRVYFFISWHTISVNNFLKRPSKFISRYKCRFDHMFKLISDQSHLWRVNASLLSYNI